MLKTLVFLLTISSTPLLAGSSTGKVESFWIHNFNDLFLFKIEKYIEEKPECSKGRYVINIATEGGKAIMASIMSAKFSNSNVYVKGNNNCNLWHDAEDVSWMQVDP